VVERRPARGHDERREDRSAAAGEPRGERGHDRDRRHDGYQREEAERLERRRDKQNDVREEEMERRAPALAGDSVQELADGLTADEEDKRLVLEGRPSGEPREQKDGEPYGGSADRNAVGRQEANEPPEAPPARGVFSWQ
jgi:hypothetical protein